MMPMASLAAALVSLVAMTSAAPPSQFLPNGFMKREAGAVTICTGANYTGSCLTQVYATNQCIVLAAPYYQNVLTFVPETDNLCRVTNSQTTCTPHGDVFIEHPGSTSFNDYNGVNYSNMTSFVCQRCDDCS